MNKEQKDFDYERGYRAFQKGEAVDENECADWYQGWLDAWRDNYEYSHIKE